MQIIVSDYENTEDLLWHKKSYLNESLTLLHQHKIFVAGV